MAEKLEGRDIEALQAWPGFQKSVRYCCSAPFPSFVTRCVLTETSPARASNRFRRW